MEVRVGLALVLVAGVAAWALPAKAPAAVPGVPALYVDYAFDCTFTLEIDPGTAITAQTAPGPTFPPGTYQLLTSMPNPSAGYPCPKPTFTLVGPGVSVSIVFAGQELRDERVLTLQPSSTYVAEDENAPLGSRKVFSTATTGSSATLVGTSAGTHGSASDVQGDIVGSEVLHYRGRLTAAVDRAGKATLELGRRGIASLRAGKYDVTVVDSAADAGFFFQHGDHKPIALASRAFVGRRTARITLTAGRWTFFSSVGRPTSFVVA